MSSNIILILFVIWCGVSGGAAGYLMGVLGGEENPAIVLLITIIVVSINILIWRLVQVLWLV